MYYNIALLAAVLVCKLPILNSILNVNTQFLLYVNKWVFILFNILYRIKLFAYINTYITDHLKDFKYNYYYI